MPGFAGHGRAPTRHNRRFNRLKTRPRLWIAVAGLDVVSVADEIARLMVVASWGCPTQAGPMSGGRSS